MKIGINIVGISGGVEWFTSKKRDWRYTQHYVKDNVIDCWMPQHNVVVYFTTYEHHPHRPIDKCVCEQTEIEVIKKFYNATDYKVLRFGRDKATHRDTYIKSLEMWLEADVDVIISTRFDIEFFKKLTEYDIDFTKVNFLFREGRWWDDCEFVADNLFIIPKQYLKAFIEALKLLDSTDIGLPRDAQHLHGVYRYLKEFLDTKYIRFISDEMYYSYNGGNPFHYLYRPNGVHETNREDIQLNKEV